MALVNKLFYWLRHNSELADEHVRKYRLIVMISAELFVFGLIIGCTSAYLQLWFLSTLAFAGSFIMLSNIIILKYSNRFILCGFIANISLLLTITLANLWSGGISSSLFGWFYVAPIIAAITTGLEGLVIIGVLTTLLGAGFISGLIVPIRPIPTSELSLVINDLNHIFIFLVVVTTLYNLLHANKDYETLLNEQNYMLYADKQKFHYLSHHDPLTSLPNRSYFHSHLRSTIETINPEQNTLTLFYMDLDGFKKINDQYGHDVGDTLLLQASKRLQAAFREKDFISRLGGDEFTALITYSKNDIIAEVLTKRIEQEFKEPFLINNLAIKCTISLGKANYIPNTDTSSSLLQRADAAMYDDKKTNYFNRTKHSSF